MPSLRDAQLGFAAALAGDATAQATLFGADARVTARLAIYRGNGRANYRNALAATFPVVLRLVGAPFFHAAVDAFVAAQPSIAGDLNLYGDRFGAFLTTYGPAIALQYLPDIARLEWAIDEANRAADVPHVPDAVLAALAVAPPERLPEARLVLDPSCRLVVSPYPLLRIWRANQADRDGDEPIALDEGGGALLVRRDPPGVVLVPLAAGDAAWLAALANGDALGVAIDAALAADVAFDLGATLRSHIAEGTIVAIAA